MELHALKLPLIKPGADIAEMIFEHSKRIGGLKNEDIAVISSKIISVARGNLVKLSDVSPSKRAKRISSRIKRPPEFVEVVLQEADKVLGFSHGVILTLKQGLLCANAGVDTSNAPPGYVVLMPRNPDLEAEEIRRRLRKLSGAAVGVVISDSNVKPMRVGTVGQAIGVAGLPPVLDCRGEPDLYGKPLRQTFRAVADQLASAAQLLMGEGNERTPVVVVRGLSLPKVRHKLSPKMAPKQDMYSKILRLK